MKFLIATVSLVVASSSFAAVRGFEGEFVSQKKVIDKNSDLASCRDERGEWLEGRGCSKLGEDSVQVQRNGTGFYARVNTTSSNASLCDFSGEAKRIGENLLLARGEGEEFVPGATSGAGSWIAATCELHIRYNADGSVTVKELNPRKCASFCGATGFLSIVRGVRK